MRKRYKRAVEWLRLSWTTLLAVGITIALASYLRITSWYLLALLIVVAGALSVGLRFLFHEKDLSPRTSRFETGLLPMDVVALAHAEDYVVTHFSPAAINYFRKLYTKLPEHLSRVDEDVHMTGRSARSTTHLVFRGANDDVDATSDTLLAPIVWARKGMMFSDFRPFNRSGALMPTLAHWQVCGLMAVTLRGLFERAVQDSPAATPEEAEAQAIADRLLLLRMVQVVTDPAAGSTAFAELADLLGQVEHRLSPGGRKMIREFCESLIDIYVIVAEVERPSGDNLMVGYSYAIVPELSGAETIRRARHGLLPTKLDVSNPLVFQANSYHFEAFSGHGDMYVYDQRMEQLESAQPFQAGGYEPRFLIRSDNQKGSTAAHLYVRRQGKGAVPGGGAPLNGSRATAGDVKSVVEFREVPPGGLGNAVAVALVTAVTVAFFALSRVGIDHQGSSGATGNQGIPALILTLPAFLAAAVGRGMTTERLLSTSLTAFYGLWMVAGTSLTAALLYIYDVNHGLPFDVPVPWGQKLNLVWLALMLFSLGGLLYLRRRKNEERSHYLRARTASTSHAVSG